MKTKRTRTQGTMVYFLPHELERLVEAARGVSLPRATYIRKIVLESLGIEFTTLPKGFACADADPRRASALGNKARAEKKIGKKSD